jgi:AI-2 transport protein TqsA
VTESIRFSPLTRFLIGAACAVIVLAGMRAASDLVNAFLLAMVITVSVNPLLRWLTKKGLPQKLAVTLVIVFVLVVVVALLLLVFLSASQLAEAFPSYGPRLQEFKAELIDWLARHGIDLTEPLNVESIEPEKLIRLGVRAVISVRNSVSGWALMILLVVFMLAEAANFPRKALEVVRSDSDTLARIYKLNTEIRQYMLIMTWSGLLLAIGNVILLFLLGVPFAPLWGTLSFFMTYIPTIGFIISLIPPTLLALLQGGWQQALIVIVGYIAIKGLVFSVFKTIVAGKRLNLSHFVIVISVVVWIWVLGPIGALLAVPLTMVVKELLLESSEAGRPLALMMDAEISGDLPSTEERGAKTGV